MRELYYIAFRIRNTCRYDCFVFFTYFFFYFHFIQYRTFPLRNIRPTVKQFLVQNLFYTKISFTKNRITTEQIFINVLISCHCRCLLALWLVYFTISIVHKLFQATTLVHHSPLLIKYTIYIYIYI